MAKSSASTILICITLAVLLLLLLASLPPRTPHRDRHRHHHRRLKLRPNNSSAPSHRPIPFDPVIADIERRREDRQWERDHFPLPQHEEPPREWEDFFDPEDYVNDEDRFNITHRIVLLFPRIDVAPADGFVSLAELADWNFKQAAREAIYRSGRELELRDRNRDGFVSFEEYQEAVKASPAYDTGWWNEDHFNASDTDGNGLLNLTEFNDFLYPADSSNPKLIQWLCKEEIRHKDRDEDGKLNFEEYFLGLFDSIQDHNEAYNHSDTSELAKKLFSQLDRDHDGFLSGDELVTVIGKVHQSERYYANQQADYALSEADSDKDSQLSLKEMIEHPYVFYRSIFSDDEDEDDDGSDYHDEFR